MPGHSDMEDVSSSETDGGGRSKSSPRDPASALEYACRLLSAPDDTHRFVGLALVKTVLDNEPVLREDVGQVTAIWDALPSKFLDRLLRNGQNQEVDKEEARYARGVAVAILHAFTRLLPGEVRNSKKLTGKSSALVNALIDSSPETTTLILQTLLTIVSQPKGALEFISIQDLSPLTEIAPQQPTVLNILSLAWPIASSEALEVPKITACISKTMPMLINSFNRTDAVTFVSFIGEVLSRLRAEVLPKNPEWLQPLVEILRRLISSRPTQEGRSAYTNMAAFLMRAYPLECPQLLFRDGKALTNDVKPFSYLFINLILIDIRSSFPSLLSKLNTPEYPLISKRLSSALNVVLFFIGYLIRLLDDEANPNPSSLSMSPDFLLKVRKSIAETMSLTIEYLRDRWDASRAGALGLHPSARNGTTTTSEGTRLTLTWDSMSQDITNDDLIHGCIRTLAMYLHEDENANLRKESAGLMDMFVELYETTASSNVDFRPAVLRTIEVILTTKEGIDAFLDQNGWETLAKDLSSIISDADGEEELPSGGRLDRAQCIVRVLLVVVDSESTAEPRETWMEVVKSAASMKPSTSKDEPKMDLQIAVLTLAAALLTSSSKGMQRRYVACTTGLLGLASQLRKEARKVKGPDRDEIRKELSDVITTLENFR